MTNFTKAIERELKGVFFFSVGACPGCLDCFGHADDPDNPTEEEQDGANDAYYSILSCESCGSSLSGDRHPAHGIIADSEEQARGGDIEHFSICTDCLMFHANGDEPENWE